MCPGNLAVTLEPNIPATTFINTGKKYQLSKKVSSFRVIVRAYVYNYYAKRNKCIVILSN